MSDAKAGDERLSAAHSGLYRVADARALAPGAGLDVVPVSLAGVTDKAALLERFAVALAFPDWFGANWDALEDCLCDLSWRRGDGHVLVLRGGEALQPAQPDPRDAGSPQTRAEACPCRGLGAGIEQEWIAEEPVQKAEIGGMHECVQHLERRCDDRLLRERAGRRQLEGLAFSSRSGGCSGERNEDALDASTDLVAVPHKVGHDDREPQVVAAVELRCGPTCRRVELGNPIPATDTPRDSRRRRRTVPPDLEPLRRPARDQ